MKAMLLAAGLGTRFQPHTLKKAKPALPFLNLPMAYYSIYLLNQIGLTDFVYNTFHLPETVRAILPAIKYGTPETESWLRQFQFQESHDGSFILGSAGGLKRAEPEFQGHQDLVLMNADELILPKDLVHFQNLLKVHKQNSYAQGGKRLGTLAVIKHPEVGKQFGGIWCDAHHRVVEIGKTPSRSGLIGWHFIGLQALSSKIFSWIPQDRESNIFYDILNPILRDHEVYVHPVECEWFETGNLQSYLHATQECLRLIDMNKLSYLITLLKTLRPLDQLHHQHQGVVYGDPNFLTHLSQAKINAFAVGESPHATSASNHFTGKLSRVVVSAEFSLINNNNYGNDLLL